MRGKGIGTARSVSLPYHLNPFQRLTQNSLDISVDEPPSKEQTREGVNLDPKESDDECLGTLITSEGKDERRRHRWEEEGRKRGSQENPTDPAHLKSGSCCFRLCFVSFVTLVGVMKDGITCVLSSSVIDVDVDVVIAIVTEVKSFFGTRQVE
jgi:hypothetical protein